MERELEPEIGVGIDFGTSNSCAGVYINGAVKIVPNNIGERITPSVVLFKNILVEGEYKKRIFVGEEAICESIDNINNYIYEIKRFIGLNYEQFINSGFNQSLNYKIEKVEKQPKIRIDYNGNIKYYSIVEISSLIIKKIVRITEDFISETLNQNGFKIRHAVFTVPTQFTEMQKNSILEAAKLAGIDIPRIINEPTAAALAYGIGKDLSKPKTEVFSSTKRDDDDECEPPNASQNKSNEKILAFDLGGGTLDITILTITKDKSGHTNFEVNLTDGDIHLGGSDFDKILIDYCVKRFCEENEINENDIYNDYTAIRRLKIKCENAKRLLSTKNEVTIQIDNFYQEIDLTYKIRQHEFNYICKPLYDRIEKLLNQVLKDGNCTVDDIDKVILVGGSTRICAIKELLKKKFSENKIKDDINPDEAVAIGATLNAAKLQIKQNMNFVLQDIIPFNIGIAVQNPDHKDVNNREVMHAIIKKFSGIPTEKEKKYKVILSDDNPDIYVKVYEGNKPYIRDCLFLGQALITNLKQKGEFEYKVRLNIDVNGKINGNIISEQLNLNVPIEFIRLNKIGYVVDKKVKIADNLNLNTVGEIARKLKLKKDIILNSQDLNEKYRTLVECSKIYEEVINKYNFFIKYNETIYEKIFENTKELFGIYLEILIMKKDIEPIIKKIKERMLNLIKDQNYIEELFGVFKELRLLSKNEYYLIFCDYMDILINEGVKQLSRGKYIRYYAKLYFEKVFFSIKKYVDETDLNIIDHDIKKNFVSLKEKNEGELKQINSFAAYIEKYINEGDSLFGSTGFTEIHEKINQVFKIEGLKVEEIKNILDIWVNMANSFDPKKRSIGEAYCLANIIKINYIYLHVTAYDKLEIYIEKFKNIMKGRETDSYSWYKEINKIINEII